MKSTTASLMYIYLAAKTYSYQACKLNDSLHSIHYDKNGVPQIHACKRLRLSKVGVVPKIFLRISNTVISECVQRTCIIGERERANLVVRLARLFVYLIFGSADIRCLRTHYIHVHAVYIYVT